VQDVRAGENRVLGTLESNDRTEIEWQLDAQDLRPVLRWIENVTAGDGDDGVTVTPGPTVNHVDTYLDTEDRRLDRAGYSVRLRRSRRLPPEATLKSLDGIGPDALRIRLELAEQVEPGEPEALALARGPVGERVRALIGSRKLVPLFDLQTRRRTFPLAAGGVPSGELLLDETAIREPGGGLASRLRRVEVEVPEAALATVGPLVDDLRRSCGLQPAVLSKYEAGLAATGGHRVEPESFGPMTFGPDDAIGFVALATLRRHFTKLLAKEPGTRVGDDIEELHDMRVASRRLRAAVALFGEFLPVAAERLRPELAWVGQTVGAVRDLDVQIADLDKLAADLPEADREALVRLRALLLEERAQARAEMLQALDSPRYERFVRRFGAMLRSRSGTRTSPARAVAPELVARRHRALRKAMKHAAAEPDPSTYHRLRIVAKRFRYALEFLSDIYPGETARLVRRTVAFQDLLGDYQDANVATARLRALSSEHADELGPETVFAMGELAARNRWAMEGLDRRVAATYAKLDGKAWKRLRKQMNAVVPPQDHL
jgi:CHAD domain-containing protein